MQVVGRVQFVFGSLQFVQLSYMGLPESSCQVDFVQSFGQSGTI